jgi:uridine kinase
MSNTPVFIGISGGSASGKTSLVRRIREELGVNCTILEMDSFYKPLTQE